MRMSSPRAGGVTAKPVWCLYFRQVSNYQIEGVTTTTDQLIRPAETPETRQAAPTELEDSLQLFFNEARRHPLLTAAEEVELAKRIERGDLAAKERMINANLRLV